MKSAEVKDLNRGSEACFLFSYLFLSNKLGPWSKTNLPFEWDKVSFGVKPPPLAEWDTLKTGLFASNLFPCERWIKIKVVSEEKITKSFFLVNKNQYSIKRDYNSETCLEELKSLP